MTKDIFINSLLSICNRYIDAELQQEQCLYDFDEEEEQLAEEELRELKDDLMHQVIQGLNELKMLEFPSHWNE